MRHVAAAPAAIGELLAGVVAEAGVDDADDDGGGSDDARVGPVHLATVGVLRQRAVCCRSPERCRCVRISKVSTVRQRAVQL